MTSQRIKLIAQAAMAAFIAAMVIDRPILAQGAPRWKNRVAALQRNA